MGKKPVYKFLLLFGIALIVTVIISWFAFPDWRTIAGGLWLLIGIAASALLVFAEKLAGIFKTLLEISQPKTLPTPLQSTSSDKIRQGLGQGGLVNWIDRGVCNPDLLRQYARIIIVGRMKQGKTREAAELIRQAVLEDLVPTDRVFEPSPAFLFINLDELQAALERGVDPKAPILLFLDDFPRYYFSEGLDRLEKALASLHNCQEVYLVATARIDQLTPEHTAWLEKQKFYSQSLPDLSTEQKGRLVDSAAGVFNMQIGGSARQAFIDASDGRPETTLIGLRRLNAQGVTQVETETAQKIARQSLEISWAQAHRYIIERQPAAEYFLDALAAFHAASVIPSTILISEYALHLWQCQRRWSIPWQHRMALRRILTYLEHFDILDRDGLLAYPDIVAETANPTEDESQNLQNFLVRHPRLLRYPRLRQILFFIEALINPFFLLVTYIPRGKFLRQSVRLYTSALRFRPNPIYFYYRGSLYATMREHQKALVDYTQAIAIDPKDAITYVARGKSYEDLGKQDKALADYTQAIAIDPKLAVAYNNRGALYVDLGERQKALADYTQAIAIDPKYATVYNNRGNLYASLGEQQKALVDYAQTIALEPTNAAAYTNRGYLYASLGEQQKALANYTQAIAINPK